ncbi:helix-turn-helix transcriptional regulator [Flammeovirgaceae bacterium SG7u.111]|nr:helix-turn-helix transcriptional regulator [Flammeovirgaceae bacterium SG7u.132]WPO37247.1 helix-turn-helix transcriptional regulator [Flammeovirgaceae bacterium SG7u.111]
MMYYNFKRVFKARGIERPFSFLQKAGFSDNFASKCNRNLIRRLELRELEKLCYLLRCTPNDLIVWEPDDASPLDKNHPLMEIKKPEKTVDMTKALNSVPLHQLAEIEQMILDKIKSNAGKKQEDKDLDE